MTPPIDPNSGFHPAEYINQDKVNYASSDSCFTRNLFTRGKCNLNYVFNKMWEMENELGNTREKHALELAAISTLLMSNTDESLSKVRIFPGDPYWTSTFEDAHIAINREMRERAYKETHWRDLQCISNQNRDKEEAIKRLRDEVERLSREKNDEVRRLREEISRLRDELADALKQANALFV